MAIREDFEIIDSHTHWGRSITLGTTVPTGELLRQADAALMQAKNAGRNTVRSYLSSDVETEHASSD